MESPVPNAAAIIRVLIIMPTTIRPVWDFRRGMLRRPNLSITRLRQAIIATPVNAGKKAAKRMAIMTSIGMPNSSSMLVLVVIYDRVVKS